MFQNFLYILNLAPHPAGAPRQNKNNHHSLFLTCPDTWPHFTVSSIHSSHIVSGDELFVNWWLVSWLVFVGFCCFFWWNCSKNVLKAAISVIASLLISYLLFLQQQFKHPVQLKEVFELVDIELFEFVEHFRFLFIECKPKILWFNFVCNKSKIIWFDYEKYKSYKRKHCNYIFWTIKSILCPKCTYLLFERNCWLRGATIIGIKAILKLHLNSYTFMILWVIFETFNISLKEK